MQLLGQSEGYTEVFSSHYPIMMTILTVHSLSNLNYFMYFYENSCERVLSKCQTENI